MADWSTPALPRLRLRAPAALLPSRRAAALAGAIVGALALAYVLARVTPLFAIRDVAVIGAPAAVDAEVKAAVEPFRGRTLVGLDGEELLRTVEALPTVVAAHYDRAFPNTLRLFVEPERPVALAVHRGVGWLLSERGRVMGRAEHGDRGVYPRIRTPAADRLALGQIAEAPEIVTLVRAVALVPKGFPVRVREARGDGGNVTLVLAGDIELRVGAPVDVPLKLAAATRVLTSLGGEERAQLAYLDVSLPERVVAADKSQVAG